MVVTGGFDPIHEGHINYFREAKALGDILIVGVNSTEWLIRKKGQEFMPWASRLEVASAIRYVDFAFPMTEDADGSARTFLAWVKKKYQKGHHIIFANGGDRNEHNIPEMDVEGISFAFGVGGNSKQNSSSFMLDNWVHHGQ